MKPQKALKPCLVLFVLATGVPAFGLDYFAVPPTSRVLDTEGKLAQGFLKEAAVRYQAGKLDEADQWARRGLELDPDAADLLLLRSRIARDRGEPNDQALALARAAVRSNRWIEGRFLDAFLLMADLLIRTHDWKTGLSEINNRFPERDLLRDPHLSARAVSILYHLNEKEKADRLAEAARGFWPDDAGIMAASLEFRLPDVQVHRWFNRYHDQSATYLKALFWYARALPPGAERLKRCVEYLDRAGGDAMAIVWALESALAAEGADRPALEQYWVGRFCTPGAAVDLDAAWALDNLLTLEAARARLFAFLGAGPLNAYRDRDHDGYPEETARFSDGRIVQWTLDNNQDNLADLKLEWKDGLPESASQQNGQRLVRCHFDAYPEIDRVEVLDGQGAWALSLPRGRLEFPVLEVPVEGSVDPLQTLPWLTVGKRNITMDPAVMRREASGQDNYRSDGSRQLMAQTKLERGIPLASRDDSDGDGRFDHLLWYERGVPVMGFRDVENSGAFDAIETYRDGKLSEVIHFDPVKGQTYRFDALRGLAEWDLDNNGRVDTFEQRTANEQLIQWFASRLDGVFDLRAEDGQVKSVRLISF